MTPSKMSLSIIDIQHRGTKHSDAHQNKTQQIDTQHTKNGKMIFSNFNITTPIIVTLSLALKVLLVRVSAIMVGVIRQNVVAPRRNFTTVVI
jgi:hypothetical protein